MTVTFGCLKLVKQRFGLACVAFLLASASLQQSKLKMVNLYKRLRKTWEKCKYYCNMNRPNSQSVGGEPSSPI